MRGAYRLRKTKEGLQALVYSAFNLKEVEERAEAAALTDAMGFAGQYDEHRRFQFEFAKAKGLSPRSRFLEIGSGPLTLGIPLIGFLDPGNYVGVDVRESVTALAYKEIARHNLTGKNPRLIVSKDFAARELEGAHFDFIWSFSVLYHLSDELAARLFEVASALLAPGGAWFANINVVHDESRWLEFPFVKRSPAFYADLARRRGLAMTELGPIKALGFRLESAEKENLLVKFARA